MPRNGSRKPFRTPCTLQLSIRCLATHMTLLKEGAKTEWKQTVRVQIVADGYVKTRWTANDLRSEVDRGRVGAERRAHRVPMYLASSPPVATRAQPGKLPSRPVHKCFIGDLICGPEGEFRLRVLDCNKDDATRCRTVDLYRRRLPHTNHPIPKVAGR
jgi:hypothetical protein